MSKSSEIIKKIVQNTQEGINQFERKVDIAEKELEITNIEKIVFLFDAMSPVADNSLELIFDALDELKKPTFFLFKKRHAKKQKLYNCLQELRKLILKMGRGFEMNRSCLGQRVTAADVYLGDIGKINIFTAEYLLHNKSKFQEEFHEDFYECPGMPISSWTIIDFYQAGKFIEKNVSGLKANLKQLEQIGY